MLSFHANRWHFLFWHSQAARRKSDTALIKMWHYLEAKKVKQELLPYTCQDVTLKKSKAKAAAFIQGKTEAHLLRKRMVHDYLKNVKYCV